MQQTLSAYLFGFALMNLFHGALADSFGRRPVVLWGHRAVHAGLGGLRAGRPIGALVFWRALQGMSAGAGMVVSRAVIRDMFPPADAQRVMSQVTIYFGVAPAIAPLIGGWLFVHADWHAIFWLLAGVGALLWAATGAGCPRRCTAQARQPSTCGHLMRGYAQPGAPARASWLLVLASGVPFNGMFLYVLSAPAFLGEHLQLAPTQFFWFFLSRSPASWAAPGRAGGWPARQAAHQIRHGASRHARRVGGQRGLNLVPPHPVWALAPMALFAFGWALMVPVVTLMVLDLVPDRRGMASSLQACVGSAANGLVAGVLAPLVMHSALGLALASLALGLASAGAWTVGQAPAGKSVRQGRPRPHRRRGQGRRPPKAGNLDRAARTPGQKLGASQAARGADGNLLRVTSRADRRRPTTTGPGPRRRGSAQADGHRAGGGGGPAAPPRPLPATRPARMVTGATAARPARAWGGLKPEFTTCANGKRQSPIDIRGGIAVDLEPVQFDYRRRGFSVIDNGHTVQVNVAARQRHRGGGRASTWCSSTSTARRKSASTAASSTWWRTWCTRTNRAAWPWWRCCWTAAPAQPVVQTVWNNLPLEKGEEVSRRARAARPEPPAARRPRLLHLHGLADHAAVQRGRAVDGDAPAGGGVAGADRASSRACTR
jgi:MFS transporter, DHA1 family, multidrug resistance protein